jgi:hypothetical protein
MTDEERAAIAAVEGMPVDTVSDADAPLAQTEAPAQPDAPDRARALLAAGFRAEVVAERTGLALDKCRAMQAEIEAARPRGRGAYVEATDALNAELAARPSPTVCNGFGPSPRRRIGPKLTDSEQWMLDSARRARGGGRGSAT